MNDFDDEFNIERDEFGMPGLVADLLNTAKELAVAWYEDPDLEGDMPPILIHMSVMGETGVACLDPRFMHPSVKKELFNQFGDYLRQGQAVIAGLITAAWMTEGKEKYDAFQELRRNDPDVSLDEIEGHQEAVMVVICSNDGDSWTWVSTIEREQNPVLQEWNLRGPDVGEGGDVRKALMLGIRPDLGRTSGQVAQETFFKLCEMIEMDPHDFREAVNEGDKEEIQRLLDEVDERMRKLDPVKHEEILKTHALARIKEEFANPN